MDRERNEDLNPHGDDIEEKIRQMLDPSIPDDAAAKTPPASKSAEKPTLKLDVKKPTTAPKKSSESTQDTPSAPALPGKSDKASKTVSIAITHHDDEPTAAESAEMVKTDMPSKEDTTPKPAPVKKITISEHDESPAEVAEKLDAAIAELDEPAFDEQEQKPQSKAANKKETEAPEKDTTPPVTDNAPSAPPLAAGMAASVTANAAKTASEKPPLETAQSQLAKSPPVAIRPQAKDMTVGDAIDRASQTIKDPDVIKDPATDRAVEDIIASESDEILEIEDAVRDTDEPIKAADTPAKAKKERKHSGGLLKSRAFRWFALLLILGSLLAAGGVPRTRYLILNTAGVRAQSSVTVLDDSTQQPLKNVQVSIGDATALTNQNGEATLSKVKLGPNQLTIQKRAFAPITTNVVIGWGSNPLQTYGLKPTGTQYEFTTIDYLSGKPLAKVQASSIEADASSNDQGVIKLTLDKPTDENVKVTFKLDGYRDETVSVDLNDTTNHTVKLVPAEKQLFVSKRSGKYDVYSIYVDGSDEKLVLPGTGSERDDMVLVPHPTEPAAALVSTRGNQHNSQGFLLSDLTIINTDDNTTHAVVAAERIQIVDWLGDNLVYVQIVSGESASSPKRYRLMSYNVKTTATKELASSNYFNDVVSFGGEIYYAPSSAYQSGKTALYKVKADGSDNQTVFNQEVWNIIRTSYDHLALAVEQQWYDYRLGDKAPAKLNAAPASQEPRVYTSNVSGTRSAWVDVRDGKGVLLVYDPTAKTDTELQTQSGITYPVRWLNDSVLVYRVKTNQETADYVVSINGGKPVKIRDVTNTGGIDRWYYY